jgi:hypothetical protein
VLLKYLCYDIDFFVDKFIYMFKICIFMSFSFLEYLLFINVLYYVRSFLCEVVTV